MHPGDGHGPRWPGLLLGSPHQEPQGSPSLRGQGSPPPSRKEATGASLLFIDIQVGSIATGLEAAAVVGNTKMDVGVFVCSDS